MLSSTTGRCFWQSDLGQGQPRGLGESLCASHRPGGSIYRRLLLSRCLPPDRLDITQLILDNRWRAFRRRLGIMGGHAHLTLALSRTEPSELRLCADQSTYDNFVLMHRGGHFGLGDPTPMPLNYV
jgi:hypothetical protein